MLWFPGRERQWSRNLKTRRPNLARKCKTADDYVEACSSKVRPLMRDLRALIRETLPGAEEGMRFGVPVFLNANRVPVIYLFASKEQVNFGFLKSAALSDPDKRLRGSGNPSKHLAITPDEPFDRAVLVEFVRQCSELKD